MQQKTKLTAEELVEMIRDGLAEEGHENLPQRVSRRAVFARRCDVRR
jgi:hypothetical protein